MADQKKLSIKRDVEDVAREQMMQLAYMTGPAFGSQTGPVPRASGGEDREVQSQEPVFVGQGFESFGQIDPLVGQASDPIEAAPLPEQQEFSFQIPSSQEVDNPGVEFPEIPRDDDPSTEITAVDLTPSRDLYPGIKSESVEVAPQEVAPVPEMAPIPVGTFEDQIRGELKVEDAPHEITEPPLVVGGNQLAKTQDVEISGDAPEPEPLQNTVINTTIPPPRESLPLGDAAVSPEGSGEGMPNTVEQREPESALPTVPSTPDMEFGVDDYPLPEEPKRSKPGDIPPPSVRMPEFSPGAAYEVDPIQADVRQDGSRMFTEDGVQGLAEGAIQFLERLTRVIHQLNDQLQEHSDRLQEIEVVHDRRYHRSVR